MDTAPALNIIVDNIVDMTDLFADIAMGDGLAPLLVLAGTIIIVFSMAVFGLLTLGALGSLASST
ncbi:hypothetical protein ACYJ1Y_05675 [Natrialbaceae archaeon A-gly3]